MIRRAKVAKWLSFCVWIWLVLLAALAAFSSVVNHSWWPFVVVAPIWAACFAYAMWKVDEVSGFQRRRELPGYLMHAWKVSVESGRESRILAAVVAIQLFIVLPLVSAQQPTANHVATMSIAFALFPIVSSLVFSIYVSVERADQLAASDDEFPGQ